MISSKNENRPQHRHASQLDLLHEGPLPIALYLVVFFTLYAVLGKHVVSPYILLEPDASAMTFGGSHLTCWLSFTAAMFVGLIWLVWGSRQKSVAKGAVCAALAASAAGGWCVLGYSLCALPFMGVLLPGIALGVFLLTKAAGFKLISMFCSAASAAMLISLLVFGGLQAGKLSIESLPSQASSSMEADEAIALAQDEAEVLGMEDVEIKVGALPKREAARYSHSSGTITLSASALQGYFDEGEMRYAIHHALAHCSQAHWDSTSELWPSLTRENVDAWLAGTNGGCPAKDDDRFSEIEKQADEYATDRRQSV